MSEFGIHADQVAELVVRVYELHEIAISENLISADHRGGDCRMVSPAARILRNTSRA
jgi:hypothetical protein